MNSFTTLPELATAAAPMSPEPFRSLALVVASVVIALLAGAVLARLLRLTPVRWTWTMALAIPPVVLYPAAVPTARATALAAGCILYAGRLHYNDRIAGGDLARKASNRIGLLAVSALLARAALRRRAQPVTDEGILLGYTRDHRPVRASRTDPASHTLICGATGSGKTVTETLLLVSAIEDGCGAVVIDPKGDPRLRASLSEAAERAGKLFIAWTPYGPATYNPYAHGTSSEIADKALAAEQFTEPHYQRMAQRYLGHAVRALHTAGHPTTPEALIWALDPAALGQLARQLNNDGADALLAYLDSLTPEQVRGLSGTRDRLAILAESELGPWLTGVGETIDLQHAVRTGAVVYFALEADRWPLLAEMLGAQIVQDLITVCAHQQANPRPTVVAIDEFSAIAPHQVVRLFGRGRSAGISVIAATQELADLRLPDAPGLLEQVLGNVSTLIAHRQSVPESAELIAGVAGTRGAWVATQRTGGLAIPQGAGTRTRGREFHIHPDDIKTLPTGRAVVATPGDGSPQITKILEPKDHRAR